MSEYYDHTTYPAAGVKGTSAAMRAELELIDTGLAKLPTLAGNGAKAVVVNALATALAVTVGTLALAGNFATTGAYNTTLVQQGSTTVTLPTTNSVMARTDAAQTFTGVQTFSSQPILSSLTASQAVFTDGSKGLVSNAVTGTGNVVMSNDATLVAPVLGAATATSINKVAITAPATSATLTLTDGSTLATSGAYSTTLTATGATNVTLPTTGTLATLAGTEELDNKTLDSSVGKGTWTASGTWTLPAVTLGGAVTVPTGVTVTGAGTAAITGFTSVSATTLAGTLSTATQNSVTTMTGLVTVGALNSGSITSGFGSIDVGADAISGGAITASGTITSNAATEVFAGTAAGTTRKLLRLGNTTGETVLGIEGATGGSTIVGSTAYDGILRSISGLAFSADNGNTLHLRIASTGAISTNNGAFSTGSGAISGGAISGTTVAASGNGAFGDVVTANRRLYSKGEGDTSSNYYFYGKNNSGTFSTYMRNDGSLLHNGTFQQMTMADTANVDVGGAAATRSVTNPQNAINIKNGIAPSGTATNTVTLYASGGKLYAMDAGGTPTQLTP